MSKALAVGIAALMLGGWLAQRAAAPASASPLACSRASSSAFIKARGRILPPAGCLEPLFATLWSLYLDGEIARQTLERRVAMLEARTVSMNNRLVKLCDEVRRMPGHSVGMIC